MSISSEIARINSNVAATYSTLNTLGADMPTEQNTDNLERTAASIKAVRYDSQSLTDAQKTQARTNIGAASSDHALSKGTDSTATKTLSFGGTFTAVTDTSVSGHQVTDTSTTYTMPSDRLFTTLVPTGTSIPASANLNTTTYLKVGRYYCSKNTDAATLQNSPLSVAFMMEVYSPLSTTIDNETNKTWVYRLRKITAYNTGVQYIQYCYAGATAGSWTYDAWYVVPRSSFAIDSSDKNGGSATLGSATNPVYVASDGTLKACTYTLGKSVPSNAVLTEDAINSLIDDKTAEICETSSVARFKNELDAEGMSMGYRVQADGTLVADQYYGSTGYIPCKAGDTLYAKGLTLNGVEGYYVCVFYNSSKAKIGHVTMPLALGSNYYVAASKTSDGFTFNIKSTANEWGTVAYMRAGFKTQDIGADPIVSVNIPIEYYQAGFLSENVKVKGDSVVLSSPSGKLFKLVVSDTGALSTEAI